MKCSGVSIDIIECSGGILILWNVAGDIDIMEYSEGILILWIRSKCYRCELGHVDNTFKKNVMECSGGGYCYYGR